MVNIHFWLIVIALVTLLAHVGSGKLPLWISVLFVIMALLV